MRRPLRHAWPRAARAIFCAMGLCAIALPRSADAALSAPRRAALTAYLSALHAANYAAAFARLSASERRYFGTEANFASIFAADRLAIDRFDIFGSRSTPQGDVAFVREHVRFYDHAHERAGSADVTVPYGIVRDGATYAIKDPYHPWRAIDPAQWRASQSGVTAIVRKLSFFTGRMEMLVTFENRGTRSVQILPYGRSVVRGDDGRPRTPIVTRIASLTDATFYKGVVLPPSARVSGTITFFTPDRFSPKSLTATLGPLVIDGAEAPFSLALPPYALPPASGGESRAGG